MSAMAVTPEFPVESRFDHLFLAFTNIDILQREQFDAWRKKLDGIAKANLVWWDRSLVDPDQRPGHSPTWRHLAIVGVPGDKGAARATLADLQPAAESDASDVVVWAYEAIGDFVRKSDGMPESRGTAKAAKSGTGTLTAEFREPSHVFMALTNVKPGREAEFQSWYDSEHVPDVVAVEAFQSGRRFHLAGTIGAQCPWEFLALYRFVGPVPGVHATLDDEAAAWNSTDALVDDDGAWIFKLSRDT